MARPSQRRSQVHNDRIYELGVAGRKTGVTLKDTGVRDEHGMEPLDALLSSPEKGEANGLVLDEDEDDDSEDGVEMDIDYTGGVGPAALLNGNGNRLPMPLPRSRSPPKTYLHSPPTKNPHLQPSPSPVRGSVVREPDNQRVQSVARKLDFGSAKMPKLTARAAEGPGRQYDPHYGGDDDDRAEDDEAILRGESGQEAEAEDANGSEATAKDHDDQEVPEPTMRISRSTKKASSSQRKAGPGSRRRVSAEVSVPQEPESPELLADELPEFPDAEDEEAEEPEPAPVTQPKRRGRPKRAAEPEPAAEGSEEDDVRPRKRRSLRTSLDEEERNEVSERQTKRPRTEAVTKAPGKRGRPAKDAQPVPEPEAEQPKATATSTKPAAKKRGRRPQSDAEAADTSLLPRGPPLPKSRGLAVSRPQAEGGSLPLRTRSGRSSYKPLAWWRGEHVDYEYDFAATGNSKMRLASAFMPSIKEIHRTEDAPASSSRRIRAKSKKRGPGRPRHGSGENWDDGDESDTPAESWEQDPGGVSGETVVWQPSHETNPPQMNDEIEVMEQQVALSNAAIVPRPVRDASFKYIKTVGLPFYGAGVLELPPGTEKRPKNSRKMFMTFFVQYGRVEVTVHETTFRIGKGGMFFVPRGNYYNIVNDYDSTARLFFSQACEKEPDPGDGEAADETMKVA